MLSSDGGIDPLVLAMVSNDERDANPITDKAIVTRGGELGFRQDVVLSGQFETCPECGAGPDKHVSSGKAALCNGCGSFISQFDQQTRITIRK